MCGQTVRGGGGGGGGVRPAAEDEDEGEGEGELQASIAAMGDELKRRDDDYERAHGGVKSCREIIAADPQWEALYQRLKRAELALAERRRKPGGCARYIARRRRYCASRAADGIPGGFCSLHAPELGDNPSAPRHEDYEENSSILRENANRRSGREDATADDDDAGTGGQQRQRTSSRKTNIHRRMKKMTNPMAAPFQVPVRAPNWQEVFADVTLPTLVDVGCAKGRFLQRAATSDAALFEARHGRHNLLGRVSARTKRFLHTFLEPYPIF